MHRKILEGEVISNGGVVVEKKFYVKPLIEKQYGLDFSREIIEGSNKDIYCRQCSGCPGCR